MVDRFQRPVLDCRKPRAGVRMCDGYGVERLVGFLRLEATCGVAHPASIGGECKEVGHWRNGSEAAPYEEWREFLARG